MPEFPAVSATTRDVGAHGRGSVLCLGYERQRQKAHLTSIQTPVALKKSAQASILLTLTILLVAAQKHLLLCDYLLSWPLIDL